MGVCHFFCLDLGTTESPAGKFPESQVGSVGGDHSWVHTDPGNHAEPELRPSPASLWNGIYVPQAARLSLGIRHLLHFSGQKDESGYCRRLPKGAASLTTQRQAQDSLGETAVRKDAKRPGRKSQELPRCTKANRVSGNDMVTLQTYYGKKKKKVGGTA